MKRKETVLIDIVSPWNAVLVAFSFFAPFSHFHFNYVGKLTFVVANGKQLVIRLKAKTFRISIFATVSDVNAKKAGENAISTYIIYKFIVHIWTDLICVCIKNCVLINKVVDE